MCLGVPIPGSGHTAYVFDIITTTGERWKVTRRYSDFLDLNKKLIQVCEIAVVCVYTWNNKFTCAHLYLLLSTHTPLYYFRVGLAEYECVCVKKTVPSK
jgi:hypothetical protein